MVKNNRRHGAFNVRTATDEIAIRPAEKRKTPPIKHATTVIFRQMEIEGLRPRTLYSYEYVLNDFIKRTEIAYVEDITANTIYEYLDSLDVKRETKLIRLKTLKAILSRYYDNGWLEVRFWRQIQIKIDKKQKRAATVDDIETLLSVLDRTTFIGFRDSVAIVLLYKTGIRINTLGELRESHIDFNNLLLDMDGSILKSHDYLKLPISEQVADLLRTLIEQNKRVRKQYNKRNDYVFITQNGLPINKSQSSNNAISKQLSAYSKRYGLPNINAHALRRAFATNLLKRGANVTLISKALGHHDLSTTAKYLDLSKEEVAENLRDYL